jgi:uncharacterized protein HemX
MGLTFPGLRAAWDAVLKAGTLHPRAAPLIRWDETAPTVETCKKETTNMKPRFLFAAVIALVIGMTCFAQDAVKDTEKAAKDTAHATKNAAKKTAEGTEKAVDAAGEKTKKAAKATADTADKP